MARIMNDYERGAERMIDKARDYEGRPLQALQTITITAAQYHEVMETMYVKGVEEGLRLAMAEVWKAETQRQLIQRLKEWVQAAKDRDMAKLKEALKGIGDKAWK